MIYDDEPPLSKYRCEELEGLDEELEDFGF
jgi:hypothetical protein